MKIVGKMSHDPYALSRRSQKSIHLLSTPIHQYILTLCNMMKGKNRLVLFYMALAIGSGLGQVLSVPSGIFKVGNLFR